jgi:membrane protein implicated in regulation of membrane protease activity
MHIISAIGLFLLPLVSFSALVQTPFFQVSDQNKINLKVGFSQFIGMSISVTVAVVAAWFVLLYWLKRKARNRIRRRQKAERFRR